MSQIPREVGRAYEAKYILESHTVPTLEDVAKKANVSTATVSRCLNLPEKVSKKTRDRVMEAVNSLGYSPNFGARALAAKRTNTIGAVVPTLENAIFARGLQAFQEEITRNGATLLVASSGYQEDVEEQQIRNLVARGADALLLIGTERSEDIYTFLKNRDLPWVNAWSYKNTVDGCFVGFDNRAAARNMAKKVIELGHTKIGMIAGITKGNDRARDRMLGVMDAVREHDLPVKELRIVESKYNFAGGANAAESILSMERRPTAIICGNDILAIGAMKRIRSLGFSIPEDISVTGFDDIAVSAFAEPELTTVHVPHREMGRLAAVSLLTLLEKNGSCDGHNLDTYIVERNSLSAPLE